jgi:hypothetical protein
MTNINDILKATQATQSIHKSLRVASHISEMLKMQNSISKSFSGLNMITEIAKGLKLQSSLAQPALLAMEAFTKSASFLPSRFGITQASIDAFSNSMNFPSRFAIPQTTIDAITSINRQHEQIFGSLRAMTDALKIQSPAIAQINNLHFALSGISGQIAAIAAQQKNWTILEDFDDVTEQTIEFTDTLNKELDEEQKRQFHTLLTLVLTFLSKHKHVGVSVLLTVDIFLRFAGIHQYYDFLKQKPTLATKTEVSQISIKQDSILHFINAINEQLKQVKENRKTNRICEVKLKPKSKSIAIVKL